jgi:hypothetical protein
METQDFKQHSIQMAYHLFKCPLKEMNYFYVSYINVFI